MMNEGREGSPAFTLIELLIVIAIIGILVGALMPVVAGMKAKAKRHQAATEVQSLAMAIRAYHTEYNRWPVPDDAAPSGGTWSNDNLAVFSRLVAGGAGNSRNINFIQLTNNPAPLTDPFGADRYYVVRISVTGNSVYVRSPTDGSISASY